MNLEMPSPNVVGASPCMLAHMESAAEAARSAFDAARDGQRVGVFATPKAEITDHLNRLYTAIPMQDRRGIDRWRSFYTIGMGFPTGGSLQIAGDPDTFRGLTLDQMFLPDTTGEQERRTLSPTLKASPNKPREYFA